MKSQTTTADPVATASGAERDRPTVAALKAAARALSEPVESAARRVQEHRDRCLVAVSRRFGGTYDASHLTFKAWRVPSDTFYRADVTRLEDDLTVARIAGDVARERALRDESRELESLLSTAVAVDAGLRRAHSEAMGRAGDARNAFVAAVRAEAYAPVERLRARLAEVQIEAEAKIAAAIAELDT